jgi:DNA helicase HerA-like ATPase
VREDAKTPIEEKLKEQFRRLASEGRKFGLFLILVSQRPDKLDRMVMSECENRAVMRVGSSFILRTTCEVLGLDGVVPKMTDKVLDFDQGRALLAGPWVSDEPAFLVSAARRTKEGGRDLRWQYWARAASKKRRARRK